MHITREEAEKRLSSPENLARRFGNPDEPPVKHIPIKLRGKDRVNLSWEDRTEIAIRARLGENQSKLAQEFNITQGNVSHIETGRTQGVDDSKVNQALEVARDKAVDKLMAALGLITEDKLSSSSARELSVIAANMSRVVEKTLPKDSGGNINLVIYSPELRTERGFRKVEVG